MLSIKALVLVLSVPAVFAKTQYMGMNIAGLEFGCDNYGTCPLSSAQVSSTATAQIQHFATDDQMNIFRFPVSWQYLTNNDVGGTLNAANFATYDKLMQTCLATGAYCAIDLHNYARVNTLIIGQGGPTDTQFADLWSQLATKYASSEKVIFGLMNEPHDLDINIWATTCQAAVTAIRTAGATSQMILLPGTNFASAGQFVSSGSAAALVKLTNLDGTTDGLILDLHKYLDVDNSGDHSTCTTDNIEDAFAIVAAYLREVGRLGLVSETGAGSDASCFVDYCAQNTFLNQNSDVFLGYISWAAGAFATNYLLAQTPTLTNGKYVDNALASSCVIQPWLDAGNSIVTSAIASTALAAIAASSTAVVASTTSSEAVVVTGTAVSSSAAAEETSGGVAKTSGGSSLVTATKTSASGTAKATGSTASNGTSTSGASQSTSSVAVTGAGAVAVVFARGLLISGLAGAVAVLL